MSWLASAFVALLRAAFSALACGVLAPLVVDWYRISSFEGGSGYFVLGLVVARFAAAGTQPGFGKGLAYRGRALDNARRSRDFYQPR